MQLAKFYVTCKNYILLSKKNTQMYILGSQSSVPLDSNGVLVGSKMTHSVCTFSAHQNVVLLVDAVH